MDHDTKQVGNSSEDVRIGHVHLKVADLERAIAFYHGVLGFGITERWGSNAAFLSMGGYHHHIALNTWQSRGGTPPPAGTTGLYHFAILYPTRSALAGALGRLVQAGVPLDGASDHGVSEALYLRDPDQNGVVNSAHPGWVKTEMGGSGADLEVSDGAKTSVALATLSEDGPTGGFFHMGEPLPW